MAYFDLHGTEMADVDEETKASKEIPIILEDDVSSWNFKRYDSAGKLQETISEKGPTTTVRVPVDWTLEGALTYFKSRGAENPLATLLGTACKAERINRQSTARQARADELGITVPKVYDEEKAIKSMVKNILAAKASRGEPCTAGEARLVALTAMGL